MICGNCLGKGYHVDGGAGYNCSCSMCRGTGLLKDNPIIPGVDLFAGKEITVRRNEEESELGLIRSICSDGTMAVSYGDDRGIIPTNTGTDLFTDDEKGWTEFSKGCDEVERLAALPTPLTDLAKRLRKAQEEGDPKNGNSECEIDVF